MRAAISAVVGVRPAAAAVSLASARSIALRRSTTCFGSRIKRDLSVSAFRIARRILKRAVRLEACTAVGVVVVDRVKETERTLLDEVVEREAEVAVARRDRTNEAERGSHELVARATVAGLGGAEQAAAPNGFAGRGSGFEICFVSSLARR